MKLRDSSVFQGVFPAITTPMHRDESLDLDAYRKHIEILLDSGVQGLVILGSLGENNSLYPDEKREVAKNAVDAVRGRVPVVSGVSETSTARARDYAKMAQEIGLDGLMVLPAMTYKADSAETMAHLRAVAAASDLPIIIYNNPVAYSVDITPEMLCELSDEPKFVAIKESSADTRRIMDIRNAVGNRYKLFAGVDDLALECAALGVEGWIAGVGLAFPKENQRLWDLMGAGRWDEAREIYQWFCPLLHLDVHVKFVQYIKLLLQEVGYIEEWVRAPRQVLQGEERERVLAVIRHGINKRPKLSP